MAPAKQSEPDAVLFVRAPPPDRAQPARSPLSSSEEYPAHRPVVEPFTLFPGARRSRIALREEFVERVARPALRLHHQPAAFNRDADLGSRTQAQDVQ